MLHSHSGDAIIDEKDWFEKDLSDFDNLQLSNEDSLIQNESSGFKRKRCQKKSYVIKYNQDGNNYPYDLWYLIGMHIAPEDIGRFALICRKTNQVLNTISFWIFLYRKYCKSEAKKYARLLVREHLSIVRTYVVKALYQNYDLFQQRFDKTAVIQKEPHFLLLSRCIRIWYSKRPTRHDSFNYYFEFRFDNAEQSIYSDKQIEVKSTIFQLNSQQIIDKNAYILHLITSNPICIGPYMGMILSRMTLNVSSDYRFHKFKMWFDSSRSSLQNSIYNTSVVTIDPVLCLRIYRWFNCPDNLE